MTRTLILFGVGSCTLFFFDHTLTILTGVVLLLAAIVSGIFTLLSPERLGSDP